VWVGGCVCADVYIFTCMYIHVCIAPYIPMADQLGRNMYVHTYPHTHMCRVRV
jgi:hypothetical protein